MSENEEKMQKKLCINPIVISTIFILSFAFCVCYFVIELDNIWDFFIAVFFALIKFWYIPMLILSFSIGIRLTQSFEDEYENSGHILIFGSIIITIILGLYGVFGLYKFKFENILEQSQIETIQPEKNEKAQ